MRMQKMENSAKLLAIMIGHEGRLNDAALDHVADNVCQLAKTFPHATQLMFLFRGYETETRRPEEVPEIARYVRKLALRIAGDVPTEKMAAPTSLLLFRCACAATGGHGAPAMIMNDAGDAPWRVCEMG